MPLRHGRCFRGLAAGRVVSGVWYVALVFALASLVSVVRWYILERRALRLER
jgi:hypothetical protein